MTQPIVTVEGHRVYVKTHYGDPCVPALKSLGAHYEGNGLWWLGVGKKAEVEKVIAAAQAPTSKPAQEDPSGIRLVGKARYKGRSYYVRWAGVTKRGNYAMRLVSLDQKVDFWADGLDPSSLLSDVQGAKERQEKAEQDGLAVLVKAYSPREYRSRTEYTTLASIQSFVKDLKENEQAKKEGTAETRTCWECGRAFTEMDARTNGGDWTDSYCGC